MRKKSEISPYTENDFKPSQPSPYHTFADVYKRQELELEVDVEPYWEVVLDPVFGLDEKGDPKKR